MIRVQDIQIGINSGEKVLISKIAKKLGIRHTEVISYKIVKQAIDARKKPNIKYVYTIDVDTTKNKELLKKKLASVPTSVEYQYVQPGNEVLNHRPVIIGSGPCGLFCALILSQMGYNPIIIERGNTVDKRVEEVENFWNNRELNPNSNVQFGEGGAGTFSDGKLTTQIKNLRCNKVLQEFVNAGANDDILYKSKPHIGTDILRDVVKNMRTNIETLGGTFMFNSILTDIKVENDALVAVKINDDTWIDTTVCVLAIGHSARDTFEMLFDKQVELVQKAFSVGLRIEHPQQWINNSQYGMDECEKIGAAEYKLVHHASNGRSVYSFCMCPGGYVVASTSEPNMVTTNGMSFNKRDGDNANSAILVNVKAEDLPHPLAGIELQREFEKLAFTLGGNNYNAPVQTVGDFLNNVASTNLGIVKPTYSINVTPTNLRAALPTQIGDAIAEALTEFGQKIENFAHPDAMLTGFETRSSSPVRIVRDDNYQSNIRGIYPAGEGAGYAGGITSSAVDGILVAEAIAKKFSAKSVQ
ncbi:MAG: hypothetical protein ATN34_04635 [Epulopiscium sp. Nele67-Bin002]|nr:MAG: hypothetical protein ATN34_04635 [Epulopiscium sp. Nele67-Bin002]